MITSLQQQEKKRNCQNSNHIVNVASPKFDCMILVLRIIFLFMNCFAEKIKSIILRDTITKNT